MDTIKKTPTHLFKAGDIVKCNTHEHRMTVGEISEDEIECDYFVESELHHEIHDKKDLTIVKS
jgi:hypothetical protein